jgi:hypothetical protein
VERISFVIRGTKTEGEGRRKECLPLRTPFLVLRRRAIGNHKAWVHNGVDLGISGENLSIGGRSKIRSAMRRMYGV